MTHSVQLSVIIVNWNSKDYVRKCLQSIYLHARGVAFEIIVVDGASYDGCDEMISSEFPQVRFLQLEKNVGFAKANNAGVQASAGKYLLLLNPDTELLEDSISLLLKQFDALPKAGALGCKLLNSDQSLQLSTIQAFPTIWNQALNSEYLRVRYFDWKLWGIAPLYLKPEQTSVVEVISGACMMVPRSVFDEVGGFTEDYFMYGEDADLCCKIARNGYHVYYVPATSLIHHGGSSSRQAKSDFSNIMMRQSVYHYLKVHNGRVNAFCYRLVMGTSSLFRLAFILILMPIRRGQIVKHGTGSLKKWLSILRWSLGLEQWVHRYD